MNGELMIGNSQLKGCPSLDFWLDLVKRERMIRQFPPNSGVPFDSPLQDSYHALCSY